MRDSAQHVGVNPGKPFILPHTNHFKLAIFRSLHSHSAAPFGFYVGHHFEIPSTAACIIAACCLATDKGFEFWWKDKRRVWKQVLSNVEMLSFSSHPNATELCVEVSTHNSD